MIAAPYRPLLLLLFLWVLTLCPLAAQTEGDGGGLPMDPELPDRYFDLYSRGDKVFGIAVGPLIPLFFIGDSGVLDNNVGPVGGTLALSYNYFVNSHVFIGAEVQGMFAPTLGKNMVYIVPMGLRGGYQFILGRFEIPLALMAGFAPQVYLEENYGGFFVKPSASLFWRFNPDWSFGLNTCWWWVPQWPKDGPDVSGNFLELTISARYHF